MRIFWLGMHKILVKTELARLRSLGFEVFNPRYLSHIPDQSAELNWDFKQPTTLPVKIFTKLSEYNFFYNGISKEIAKILNEHFDAVIVTIHPDWLHEVLKVYKKKVIYRTYGQVPTQSEMLFNNGAYKLICDNPNFYFSPHAEEVVETEDTWLRERAQVIPYCLTGDIFEHIGRYNPDIPKSGEIAVSCPNIDSNHYYHHYKFIKKNLPDYYKMYGVQLRTIYDSQIVGTIPRQQFIDKFLNSSAFFYTYDDARVCYLPPIEMMILGGPVIFLKGSLLDRYFGEKPAPGRAHDIVHAQALCERLRNGDIPYAKAIIESQKSIREIYYPEYVWPIFDRKIKKMLSSEPQVISHPFMNVLAPKNKNGKKDIILFHHFPGKCVHSKDAVYSAHDGIPRVMRLVVKALLESGKYNVTVTARRHQQQNFYGFFKTVPTSDLQVLCIDDLTDMMFPFFRFAKDALRWLRKKNKLRKVVLDNGLRSDIPPARGQTLHPQFSIVEKTLATNIRTDRIWLLKLGLFTAVLFGPILIFAKILKNILHKGFSFFTRFMTRYEDYSESILTRFEYKLGPLLLARFIDSKLSNSVCLIPHYYLFAECLGLSNKTVMYIPDFTPHFFEETGEFGLHLKESAIGQQLAKKTSAVFTNSLYSKGYLSESRLQIAPEKVAAFYLPNLNLEKQDEDQSSFEIKEIQKMLDGSPYIFYPTQPRANKNLGMLFRILKDLSVDRPNLKLVLTCNISKGMQAYSELKNLQISHKVIFQPNLADSSLSWLYKNSKGLVFTSLMEGNFPPQIFEALYHRIPIVATRLPLILERLGNLSKNLQLCSPTSTSEMIAGARACLDNPEQIIRAQEPVRELILSQGSWEIFKDNVLHLFDLDNIENAKFTYSEPDLGNSENLICSDKHKISNRAVLSHNSQ